jgi:hypothetical protein
MSVNDDGYGRVTWRGESWRAHRLSYTAFVAPIRSDLSCLHKCDVPACINPAHLYLGTQRDNISDFIERGVGYYWNQYSKSVLTEVQVAEIKFLCAERPRRFTHRQIADAYKVTRSTVSSISRGEHWRHVKPKAPMALITSPPPTPPPTPGFIRRI